MKKVLFLMACAFALPFVFLSCKSTPEKEDLPVEEKVDTELENTDISNKALLESVEASRQSALEAGADKSFAKAFTALDFILEKDKANVSSADKDPVMAEHLKDLDLRYKALAEAGIAKAKKEKIDSNNFVSYNKASYDEGVKVLNSFDDDATLLLSGKELFAKAQSASASFDAVLDAAYRVLAKDERTKAFVAKKGADEVKASVSRKTEYDEGVNYFKTGDTNYVTKAPESAYNNYIKAKEVFEKLAAEISEARAKAKAAVEAAKKRVSQSEDVAVKADTQAPLGEEKVAGIEDEGTQLLESDDFSEAEKTVVELNETLVEEPVKDSPEAK